MRIYTCTPVAFGGGPDFFARDSGLLCRGFQSIGVDSMAVMPGERQPEDQTDLIRTDYRNLESADWWKSHNLDALVLYAWGRPQYRKIAKAIHDSGVFLILNHDSAALMSPLAGIRNWVNAQWIYGGQGKGTGSWLRFLKAIFRGLTIGLAFAEPLRASHLKCGDVISCVSPAAADRHRRICRIYGGETLAKRVKVIPHPVEPEFIYSGVAKIRQVVCVGRWNDEIQKRTSLLIQVIGSLIEGDQGVTVIIAGDPSVSLRSWHRALEDSQQSRVRLAGKTERAELLEIFGQSQVFYSPSSYESFGIAAAEALCCGCSVVSGNPVTMPSFEWFASERSGTLANKDDCEGHGEALSLELKNWENGGRDAPRIAETWCGQLHAGKVAEMILASRV